MSRFYATLAAFVLAVFLAASATAGNEITGYNVGVTDWTSYSPTASWSTNCTVTAYYRLTGDDTMDLRLNFALSGATDTASLTFELPAGWQIDTTVQPQSLLSWGTVTLRDSDGGTYYHGTTLQGSGDPDLMGARYYSVSGTTVRNAALSNSAPVTIASGDFVQIQIDSMPVTAE